MWPPMSKPGVEPGLLSEEGGQANGNLVGLVLGAAGKVEHDAVAQVAKLLGAGHGKKAIAAKLGKDGLGDGGRHLVVLR